MLLAASVLFTTFVVLGAIPEVSQVDVDSPPTSPFAHVTYAGLAWLHLLIALSISTWGALSALDSSPVGLSIFIVALLLNFLICAPQAPSFLFAQRYIFDIAAGYVAFKLRSNLTVNWVSSARHD